MKRNPELKIKLKSLAAEARIIRKDEIKAYKASNPDTGNSLHYHRVLVVRPEARATLLAYQYLRGVPYVVCERTPKTNPNWDKVWRMVKKFGVLGEDHESWSKLSQDKAA